MKRTLLCMTIALVCSAADPWTRSSPHWTQGDAERVLSASPWAKVARSSNVTIRWESALPIQMALKKTGTDPIITSDPSYYAVALLGLHATEPTVQPEAWLKPNGRKSIPAAQVTTLRGAVVFLFPRLVEIREPIVFRLPFGVKIGNEIEFQARIGSESIREKFSLGAMTYLGQLEL